MIAGGVLSLAAEAIIKKLEIMTLDIAIGPFWRKKQKSPPRVTTVDGISRGTEQVVFSPISPTNSVQGDVYLLSLCPNSLLWYKSCEG